MRLQPSMARCIEARSVRSPFTTSAPRRRRGSARPSSRRTKARTLCPLASKNSVRLRPMPPTAPAAPVTRIGLSCLFCVVMSLTHRIGLGQRSERVAHVSFGSKADICSATRHVRFTLNSDIDCVFFGMSALGHKGTLLVDYHVDTVEQRRGYS